MIRTQIQLSEEQAGALKRLAAERGVSMAALIRDAVGAILRGESRDARWVRAWTVVGKHASAERNLAVEHDRYLAEDYAG